MDDVCGKAAREIQARLIDLNESDKTFYQIDSGICKDRHQYKNKNIDQDQFNCSDVPVFFFQDEKHNTGDHQNQDMDKREVSHGDILIERDVQLWSYKFLAVHRYFLTIYDV